MGSPASSRHQWQTKHATGALSFVNCHQAMPYIISSKPFSQPARHIAQCNFCNLPIEGDRYVGPFLSCPKAPLTALFRNAWTVPTLTLVCRASGFKISDITCALAETRRRITPHGHPFHGFVKISKPEDYVVSTLFHLHEYVLRNIPIAYEYFPSYWAFRNLWW